MNSGENKSSQSHDYSDSYAKPKNDIVPHNDIALKPTSESLNMTDSTQISLADADFRKPNEETAVSTPWSELALKGKEIVESEKPKGVLTTIWEGAKKKVSEIKDSLLLNVESMINKTKDYVELRNEIARNKAEQKVRIEIDRKMEKENRNYKENMYSFFMARGRNDLVKSWNIDVKNIDEKKARIKRQDDARLILVASGYPIPGDTDGLIAEKYKDVYSDKKGVDQNSTLLGYRKMSIMDAKDLGYPNVDEYIKHVIAINRLDQVKASPKQILTRQFGSPNIN